MDKRLEVAALGELLIDLTYSGVSEQNNSLFEANPGGAPCNVLAMLAKLGHKTAFLGKVGNDLFGRSLRSTIERLGIDATGLVMDPKVNTTLAIAMLDERGDREFSFYRAPGADMMFLPEEVHYETIRQAKIFHYGSLSMTHEQVRKATHSAAAYANEQGLLLSYDPNYRPPLWENVDIAISEMRYGIEHCQILKISDDELQLIEGDDDLERSARNLIQRYGIQLLLLTKGKAGCAVFSGHHMVEHHAFQSLKTIDTTGAGDTFMGCALDMVLQTNLQSIDQQWLQQLACRASAAAALVTTKKGAMLSMPTGEEIDALVLGEK